MDLALRGTPSARSHRPTSSRNPITGEETVITPTPRQDDKIYTYSRPVSTASKPANVPDLDLKFLQGKEVESYRPIEIENYPLNSHRTDVSWGTHTDRSYRTPRSTAKNVRPSGVPTLSLAEQQASQNIPQQKPPTPKVKQPTAWDKVPVPEDLDPAPEKYKEIYQQYQDEMKNNYKSHTKYPGDVSEEEIQKSITKVKNTYSKPNKQEEIEESSSPRYLVDKEDEVLDKSWTKQNFSTAQMLKKMDAEELLEYNKKQKLIETVLIDQLSRAVISDPEQDVKSPHQEYDARRNRGSHRFLHESKVRTNTTATENLLSRRVRFGARILTRNGHDALRELTGFFFHIDNSLTIYEFRQFGKNAKALPFINRGKYCHPNGPLKGQLYTLSDIYSGAVVEISTENQHSIPTTLQQQTTVTFCITDVDDKEKEELLLEGYSGRTSYRQEMYEKMQLPNKEILQNRLILADCQAVVKKQIKHRGVKTVTGLGRHYRKLSSRTDGILDRYDLERGLVSYRIELTPDVLDPVFEIIDPDYSGFLDYSVFMKAVIGSMNEFRKSLVRKAFRQNDATKKGHITLSDIDKFYRTTKSARTGIDSERNAIQAFLEVMTESSKQTEISYIQFEEYYDGLSIGVDSDDDFANILRNTWGI